MQAINTMLGEDPRTRPSSPSLSSQGTGASSGGGDEQELLPVDELREKIQRVTQWLDNLTKFIQVFCAKNDKEEILQAISDFANNRFARPLYEQLQTLKLLPNEEYFNIDGKNNHARVVKGHVTELNDLNGITVAGSQAIRSLLIEPRSLMFAVLQSIQNPNTKGRLQNFSDLRDRFPIQVESTMNAVASAAMTHSVTRVAAAVRQASAQPAFFQSNSAAGAPNNRGPASAGTPTDEDPASADDAHPDNTPSHQ